MGHLPTSDQFYTLPDSRQRNVPKSCTIARRHAPTLSAGITLTSDHYTRVVAFTVPHAACGQSSKEERMKHYIGLGIAMFAGAVIGAAAVGGLHAQTKPKAYQVTEQTVVDASALPASTNPDGSTKWIFAQLTNFNGFAVVDFATHKEIKRIQNPDLPPGKAPGTAGADPSHGMAVTSDGKTLLVNSRINNALYAYSLPDLKLLGGADLGGKGAAWVTLTPDGKTAYVANAVTNDVSVVDIKSLKEVTRIPVGFVPKRNTTGMLP